MARDRRRGADGSAPTRPGTSGRRLAALLAVYVLGLVSGIQLALYLYDRYDDGVADWRSLAIGVGMVVISILVILLTARRRPSR